MKDRQIKWLLLSSSILFCSQFSYAPPVAAEGTVPASASNQQILFDAIDSGRLDAVKSHVNFLKAFQVTNPAIGVNPGVSLEFTDLEGNTPLLRAARQKNVDIARYLVSQGANINAFNYKWETPLIVSYNNGNYDVAKYLLSMGADDAYNVAQRIQAIEAAAGASAQNVALMKIAAVGVGTGAAIGGAVAAFGGNGANPVPVIPITGVDCGAGSGIHPENCTPSSFLTAEAEDQEGIEAMKAHYALGHGYDGRVFNRNSDGTLVDDAADARVIIGIVDTGVDLDHSDLDDNLLTSLSVTCNTSGNCTTGGGDTIGHGTNVAGIMVAERNDTGIYGVAPEANLIVVNAESSGSISLAASYSGIDHLTNNGAQVINNSYGNDPIDTFSVADLQLYLGTVGGVITGMNAYQNAVANNIILVFATGNSGGAQPSMQAALPLYFQGATAPAGVTQPNYDAVNPSHYDWSQNWVAVVSLDSSNTLSTFSNQCGVAMDWCLAAPGEITNSTENGGGYSGPITGTSFAAPNVTGAIAVMLGAFPQLAPEEVLQILFDTATDLGAVGVDVVYGHGLVNLEAASDPTVGGWTLAVPGSSSLLSFDSSGFSLSAPFGSALAQNHLALMFLDGYGKDYIVPLSRVSRNLVSAQTPFLKLARFAAADFNSVVNLGRDTKLSFSGGTEEKGLNTILRPNKLMKFAYRSAIPTGANKTLLGFSYKTNVADLLASPVRKNLVTSDAFRNPYLNLAAAANSSMAGYAWDRSVLNVGYYSGKYGEEYNYRFDTNKNVSGVFSEYTYNTPQSHVSFAGGVSFEQKSLLGSETSGAFGIDKSVTYHSGASGRYEISDRAALVASANVGLTSVSASGASIFTGFDSIVTNAFAAGMEFGDAVRENDTLGFAVSQPLRVATGRAGLTLPIDVAASGQVLYTNRSLDLSPRGREVDFEAYYHVPFSAGSELSMNAVFRKDPANDDTVADEAVILGKYRLAF